MPGGGGPVFIQKLPWSSMGTIPPPILNGLPSSMGSSHHVLGKQRLVPSTVVGCSSPTEQKPQLRQLEGARHAQTCSAAHSQGRWLARQAALLILKFFPAETHTGLEPRMQPHAPAGPGGKKARHKKKKKKLCQ